MSFKFIDYREMILSTRLRIQGFPKVVKMEVAVKEKERRRF